jgi:hypothetical protein
VDPILPPSSLAWTCLAQSCEPMKFRQLNRGPLSDPPPHNMALCGIRDIGQEGNCLTDAKGPPYPARGAERRENQMGMPLRASIVGQFWQDDICEGT